MDVIFLESGEDLEAQLKRLKMRKKRAWYTKITRKQWFILGGITVMLLGGCLVSAVVLMSKFVVIGV